MPFDSREHGTLLTNYSVASYQRILQQIKWTKWNVQKWRGLTLMKDPMSLSIYQQMLQDQRFKTIVEIGTYEGGAALWMEDINKSIGNECTIYTVDKDTAQVNLPSDSSVIFKELDVYEITELHLPNIAHPLLVIEDAHENVPGVLQYFDRILKEGDYLVVEDTLDDTKHQVVADFVKDKAYLVDATYCDMWGYNNSYILNSILRKG